MLPLLNLTRLLRKTLSLPKPTVNPAPFIPPKFEIEGGADRTLRAIINLSCAPVHAHE
jgi:hypothetical protein